MRKCLVSIQILCLILIKCSFATKPYSLMEIYHLSIHNSPILGASYSAYQIQNSKTDIKLGELLPQLNLTSSTGAIQIAEDDSSGTTVGSIFNAGLSQSIFNYPAYQAYQSLDKQATSEYFNYLQIKQELSSEIINTYLTIIYATSDLTIAKSQVETLQNLMGITNELHEKKLIKTGELKQIESHYFQAKAMYLQKKNYLQNAYYALANLTGKPINNIIIPKSGIHQPLLFLKSLTYWQNNAEKNNLSLQALTYQVQAKEKEIQACYGKYMPQITLKANYGYNINPFIIPGSNLAFETTGKNPIQLKTTSLTQQTCISQTTIDTIPPGTGGLMNTPLYARYISASVGIVLTWNIFSGGVTSAYLKQSTSKYEQSRYLTIEKQREINNAVQKNYILAKMSYLEANTLKQSISSSENAYTLMIKQYSKNLTTLSDALILLEKSFNTQYKAAKLQLEYNKSIVKLLSLSSQISIDLIRSISSKISR